MNDDESQKVYNQIMTDLVMRRRQKQAKEARAARIQKKMSRFALCYVLYKHKDTLPICTIIKEEAK